MSTATTVALTQRELELLGPTVVVIGGSAGIGLETANAHALRAAKVILIARNPTRLPGRGLSNLDVVTLPELLREAETHHGDYEPTAPQHRST